MAIQSRQLTDAITEIYSDKNGGGKSEIYITEAKATMHHTFCTRRTLQQDETPEDFVECTVAQRTAFEQAEAEWTRPPQLFIDEWTEACGIWGGWNEDTGFFELNGLLNITYPQAIAIRNMGTIDRYDLSGHFRDNDNANPVRTNLPRRVSGIYDYTTWGFLVQSCFRLMNLEVLNLCHYKKTEGQEWFPIDQTFSKNQRIDDYSMDMPKCKRIIGIVDMQYARGYMSLFHRTALTQGVKLGNVCQDLRLLCNVDIDFLIAHAKNTGAITLSCDSRGSITDAQIEAAAEKNIRFHFYA